MERRRGGKSEEYGKKFRQTRAIAERESDHIAEHSGADYMDERRAYETQASGHETERDIAENERIGYEKRVLYCRESDSRHDEALDRIERCVPIARPHDNDIKKNDLVLPPIR